MPTVRGRQAVDRFFKETPEKLRSVLRGAARAGATVLKEEAEVLCISAEVRAALKVATRHTETEMRGLVQVKGPGAYIAPWLEYGTTAHFISVDDSQRQGRSIGRINRQASEPESSHSLVIGGKFVGTTVLHPGARPHPFMRPALDLKAREAVAAAQSYLNARVKRTGISGGE